MMTLVGDITFILIGLLLITILIRILIIVRNQTNRLKELESQMRLNEEVEVQENNG